MGQKTNSNILRFKPNSNVLKSKYFYKTAEESSLLIYQELQIKNYINQFLTRNGFSLYNYKIEINNSTLFIWSSYFTTTNFLKLINNKNIKIKKRKRKPRRNKPLTNFRFSKIRTKSDKRKTRNRRNYGSYDRCLKYKYFRKGKFRRFKNPRKSKFNYKIKKFKGKKKFYYFLKKKYKNRRLFFKKYKNNINEKKYKIFNEIRKDTFIEKFLQGLNLFVKLKHNIYLNLQNLNSSLTTQISNKELPILRKVLISFKQYWNQKNFSEAINIFLITVRMKTSAQFLADYIAKELKNYKLHNRIIMFFKRALNSFFKIPSSKINGIKIVIKGRFNSAPRAKSRSILIGRVPVQTLNANIDYNQGTSYTKNGTFGIKVWTF